MIVPRLLAPLAALACAVPALSGCGAEEAVGVDVAKAAEATREKGTARMTMTMRMSGLGLPGAIEVPAEGVTSLVEPRADFTMDVGNLLQIGTGDPGGKIRIVFDGADLYVDPPKLEGLRLPGGGGWIALDLRRVVDALGIDPEAAGALFTVDPASQLRALTAAGELEEKGGEEVNGVPTTHYAGSYSAEDVVETLPEGRRAKVLEAFEKLAEKAGDADAFSTPIPVEMWVDDDAVVHRMRMSSNLPGQNGAPAGRMDMTYELSDFGAALDVQRPEDATDVTDMIVRMLRSSPATMG